jgi:hypothetical protein
MRGLHVCMSELRRRSTVDKHKSDLMTSRHYHEKLAIDTFCGQTLEHGGENFGVDTQNPFCWTRSDASHNFKIW